MYKIGEVKLAGTMVVPEPQLKRLILVRPGDTFSNKMVTQLTAADHLPSGRAGLCVRKGRASADRGRRQRRSLTDVFRRARQSRLRRGTSTSSVPRLSTMRSCGARCARWRAAGCPMPRCERSKERIQRLPYVEKVDYETTPVAEWLIRWTSISTIKEGLPGQFGGGVGYSESQGIILERQSRHSNFMGAESASRRRSTPARTARSTAFRTPTRTAPSTGVARTISLAYRDVTQFVSASSDFGTRTLTAGLDYSLSDH